MPNHFGANEAQGAGSSRHTVKLAAGQATDLTIIALGDAYLMLGNDTTYDHNLRTALMDSRQRYKDFVECSSDFAWETNADGRFEFVSPGGALGYTAEHITTRRPGEFEAHSDSKRLPFHAREAKENIDVWMRSAAGDERCLSTSCVPRFDADGCWLGARGVCHDVTELRRREAELKRAQNRERLLAELVNTIRDEVDSRKVLRRAAVATGHALGAKLCCIYRLQAGDTFENAAVFGDGPVEAINELVASGAMSSETETDLGRVLPAEIRLRDRIVGIICLYREFSVTEWGADDRALLGGVAAHLGIAIEQIANHEALTALSREDELTGLLNRRAFMAEVEKRISSARRSGRKAALLYADLDNFKPVNDVHGHGKGDAALKAWAKILCEGGRCSDIIARLGGDEFALWIEDTTLEGARARGARLISGADRLAPFSAGPDKPLAASVGIAVFDPRTGEPLKGLIARADASMYQAKRAGKATLSVAEDYVESGKG